MWIDISSDEYFSMPNTYGSTDLKRALKSAAHVQEKTEPTPAMLRGTLVHSVILEGAQTIVSPKFDLRTNAGKAAKAEFVQTAGDRLVITQDECDMLNAMCKSIQEHPFASALVRHSRGIIEQAGIVPDDNINRRIKPDIRNEALSTLIDLKTITDASGEKFARQATNYGYFLQAAYYLDTANMIEKGKYKSFVFIVIETEYPFGCRVFEIEKTGVELGREQYQKGLEVIKNSVKVGKWETYSKDIEILVPPAFAMFNSGV